MIKQEFPFQSLNRYTSRGQRKERADCICGVTFYPMVLKGKTSRKHLMIVTELEKNTGMSVTNSWEGLGPQLADFFGVQHGSVMFVEHYGPKSYADVEREHDYTLIEYKVPLKRSPNGAFVYKGIGFRSMEPTMFNRDELRTDVDEITLTQGPPEEH